MSRTTININVVEALAAMKPEVRYHVTKKWYFWRDDTPNRGEPSSMVAQEGEYTNTLTVYDEDGKLAGWLRWDHTFHQAAQRLDPHAKEGEFFILVRPRARHSTSARKQGYGRRLLHRALDLWPIDLVNQRYSRAGLDLARAVAAERLEGAVK